MPNAATRARSGGLPQGPSLSAPAAVPLLPPGGPGGVPGQAGGTPAIPQPAVGPAASATPFMHQWQHDQWMAAQGMAGLKEAGQASQAGVVGGAAGGPMTHPGAPASSQPQAGIVQPHYTHVPQLPAVAWGTVAGGFPAASATSHAATHANLAAVAGSSPIPKQRGGGRAGKSKRTAGAPHPAAVSPTPRRAVEPPVEIPVSCRGPGEMGWHPDLLEMPTIQLNDFITKQRLEPEQIKALKELRRRIKNRRYTQRARARQRAATTDADAADGTAKGRGSTTGAAATVTVGVQCTPDTRTTATQT